jgi:hypothetical protein
MIAICMCSCRVPDSYPPPPQYNAAPSRDVLVLRMGFPFPNPRARALDDIIEEPEAKGRRWTGAHPAFSFMLNNAADLDFYMSFAVHGRTFAATGPVTLSVHVNGELIDRPRFDTAGDRKYSHPVPSLLLQKQNPVIVRIDVDPTWAAPDGGTKLGIVLFAIGFEAHAE